MATHVRSHSKINLGLAIGPPRPDGYHDLSTVYQTLELHDLVTVTAVEAAETRITLGSNHEKVPLDATNTAWRMVAGALEQLGRSAEVEIHIEKKLPVQGGLGAGSANAVAALIGLLREMEAWSRPLKAPPLHGWLELAERIGSDVPLFLLGGAVLGWGRGEKVAPLPDEDELWCVVALPEVGVSTPQAFRDWDALLASGGDPELLTPEAASARLSRLNRSYAGCFACAGSSGVSALGGGHAETPILALVRTGIQNDFERVVFPQNPAFEQIKRQLEAGNSPEAAVYAALSGSGAALFGLYSGEIAANAAVERLRAAKVQALLTRTIGRKRYWAEMLQGPGR